ncbi:Probable cobalt transporter subunit (CbtA) [Kosakonia arachidis]|uniref:Probable cobalt transporter subunit (CbtA) n=1 Tax=Kosakonia arachidis TaxID=551989 RepID=A0A1I7B190_9ENTR|nr:CbtA family protein [Kosakonia arachidis]SFT80963.1 Probable cobalt transporter subunit (CbtA) [Kosakonia arachidis]
MTGKLLLQGMIAGLLAGIIAFSFARFFGEPQIDRAISFEEALSHKQLNGEGGHHHEGDAGGEVFSRKTQSGAGLLSGMILFSAAMGGALALVWSFCWQRTGPRGARALALSLSLGGFLIMSMIPGLKYPPNPPAVGDPSTIGYRTGLYFSMLLVSAVIVVTVTWSAHQLSQRLGGWNAALWGGLAGMVMLIAACMLMPAVNEIPEGFSADLLWRFRLSAFGTQLTMWCATGLLFGLFAERTLRKPGHRYLAEGC